MRPGQTPALWLAGSLALGIWAAYTLRPAPATALAVLLPAFLFLALALRAGRKCPPLLYLSLACASFFGFGLLRMAGDLPENQQNHFTHASPGTHIFDMRLIEKLRPTSFSNRWLGEVTCLDGTRTAGKVLLSLPDSLASQQWAPGDRLLVHGVPSRNTSPANPHQFDYGAYLNSLGVYASLRLQPGQFRHIPQPAKTWGAKIARLQQRLLEKLDGVGFAQAETGLLQALLLGNRTALEPGQYASYQRAGAAHVLAVSGLHVGVFSGLVSWLLWPLRRLRRGRALQAILVVLALWAYVLLAGAAPSAVRAAVLFSLLSYALASQRSGQSLHFWALAVLVLLGVAQPLWLFQAGFQLSFAAVWAILVFYAPLYRLWPLRSGIGAYVGQLSCVGTAAQLGILPLSLYYFHQLPLHFLLANLLLVPLLGLVLGWGFIVLLASAAGTLHAWLTIPFEAVLRSMNSLAGWLGRQEAFLLTGIPWGTAELCLGIGALLALAHWARSRSTIWLRGSLACILALQGYTLWQDASHARKAEWLVPQRVAAGGFWLREGPVLRVFSPEPGSYATLLQAYRTGERIRKVWFDSLQNGYRLGGKRLLVVDAGGVYDYPGEPTDLLLLTGSPRIHLERLIERRRPGFIVADGNNYASYIRRWEQSCRRYGIPFHATSLHGAFTAKLPGEARAAGSSRQ